MRRAAILKVSSVLIPLATTGCMARQTPASSALDLSASCGTSATPPSYEPVMETPVAIPGPATLNLDSVVIYYAVDTNEAFMQAAVDEDLRALRAACELTADQAKRGRINWIAFVNSHFVDGTPSYLRCKAGEFKEEAYPTSLLDKMNLRIAKLTNPATHAGVSDEIKAIKVKGYEDFPFSDYILLAQQLNFARKEFPETSHVYHIHLKSHGSAKLALTGLTEEQWKKKDTCQKAVLQEKQLTLPAIAPGAAGLSRHADGSVQTLGEEGQVFLGEEGQAVLGDEGQAVLGEEGQAVLGTEGQVVLGDEIGLGADSHFGSETKQVMAEISNFVTAIGDTKVGYLILEGCYSAGGADFLDTAIPFAQSGLKSHLNKIYAASGSLWYRNFDWSVLLANWLKDDAAASSDKLVEVIDARSVKVVNWKKSN